MENKEKKAPAANSHESKKMNAFTKFVEKGKASGTLTAQEIDNLIVELDLDVDEFEKLNEMIEAANINIVDDISAEALSGLSLEVDLPKETDAADTIAVNENAAMDDPVKVYLKEIGTIPLLSGEEEQVLAMRISEGDEEAKKKLAEANLRLVVSIAKRYVGRGMQFLDLIQEGNIGLITAAERFKFDKETEFSTYAVFWIEQKIMRAISNTGLAVRLPVQLVQKILKATRIDKELQTNVLDVRKRIELVAQRMELKSEDVRRLFKLRDVYFRLISLDVNVGEDMDTPLANFIPDERSKLEDDVSLVLLREQIDDVLETLSPRERDVLILRYGLEDGTTRTLEEVGKIFKLTRERIRQIENKALRKLRHPSRSKKLKDFLDF